ncbi:methionyl-tRNA formyltransferase [Leptospira santarosai]|uniref:Formyl transferase, C-terminal domain protein n=1 Tax=Leptospira santarosai serovar Arenal str. MAVJ 401 TaxID=1049976 RepID=M6JFG2_9LEPT|nr:formyltransferase family protein [Leptospira santarosai]EMN20699.1 formyl transferase, C-terminal domain protein [Leptospira santarosai serovar Arenal str. MAVJ 401]
MKIGYFADGPWSHLALEKIAADKRLEVSFIVPRYDHQDKVLEDWARKLNIDFIPIDNVNLPSSLEKLSLYKADIFVSMSFNQILKRDFLALPPLGTINCHAGALPYYRGRNILNWVLINGAKEFGVTVHYVDESIDTGDIIIQKKQPIDISDTYKTLLEKAIKICSNVLYESLIQILENKVKRIKQSTIHSLGFYSGRRIEGDEWIDWNWPSERIFNFIRAITLPGPCAKTACEGYEILIETSSLVPNAISYIGTSGEIVGVTNDGVFVKTGDSVLLLKKLKLEQSFNFKIGKRFENKTDFIIRQMKERIISLEGQLNSLKKVK